MKTLHNKLSIKGASWDSIFLATIRIVTTLTSIVETKILSIGFDLTQYGTYSQISVVISICTALLLLGLGDALNYFYNNDSSGYDKSKRIVFVNTIFALEILAGIIAAVALFFGRNLVSAYYSNPALSGLIVFIALRPMLANLLMLYQTLFVSVGRAKMIAIRNLVLSLVSIGVLVVSVYVFHDLRAVFISTLIVAILQLVFFAFYFKKKEFSVRPQKADFSLVKQIVPYALPMGVFALTSTLSRDMDRLVIGFLSDTETIAIYSNCSKLLPFDLVTTSFATVLIPYIMRYITSGDKRAPDLFKNYLKIGYYSVFLFGFGTIIVTNQIIPFLYSAEYLAGKNVFILYVFDSMLRFASMHLILAASGKTKTIMKYSLIALGINAVLNVILFKLFGMIGPAVSTLLVTAGYTFAILNKTRKTLNAAWKDLFDFGDFFLYLGSILGVGALTWVGNYFLLKTPLNPYLSMFLSLAFFALTVFILFHKKIFSALKIINSMKLSQ